MQNHAKFTTFNFKFVRQYNIYLFIKNIIVYIMW